MSLRTHIQDIQNNAASWFWMMNGNEMRSSKQKGLYDRNGYFIESK